ncbi:MAG: hypothetical protein ACEPO2_09630 [Pelagibaca sp.]
MRTSSTVSEFDTGADVALVSEDLKSVRQAMTPIVTREGVGIISGSRTLTRATDKTAIGKALLQVAVFTLADSVTSERAVLGALEEIALDLQRSAIADTPVSYPKDDPEASARALAASDDWSSQFLSWEPENTDEEILTELAATLQAAVTETADLSAYAVESQSWTFQRAGIAIIDPSTGEGLWYSYRTVRALTGRR